MDATENFDLNAIKIANYLEDKMAPDEEETFMQELSDDEALRNQYEEELHIQALLGNDDQQTEITGNSFFQPADEHIAMIGTALEKKTGTPVIQLFSRFRYIAAAVLIIIAGSIIFLIIKQNKGSNPPELTKAPSQKNPDKPNIDSIKTGNHQPQEPVVKDQHIKKQGKDIEPGKTEKHQSPFDNEDQTLSKKYDINKDLNDQQSSKTNVAADAFAKYYSPYTSDDDPVQVSNYYSLYKKGEYAQIYTATEPDIEVKGSNDKQKIWVQYLQLYKGLAYLADNKPSNAIRQFNLIKQSAGTTEPQYYGAQWYIALAWLKKNEVAKCAAALKEIAGSSSPYKPKASLLLKELNQQ